MSTTRLPPKKDVALALLESSTVLVHLDPRNEAARVPPWFKKQPQLVLQIGLNMPVPIPDLNVDDEAVSCTLSFNRSPHFCYVPWSAVYALIGEDGRGMVWPDDVPPEVAAQARAQQKKQEQKSRLRAVAEPEADPEAAPAAAPRGKKRKKAAKPALQSVPAAEQPAAEQPAAEQAGEVPDAEGPETVPAGGEAAPGRSPEDEAAQPAGKRKLPPYLRVVK